MGMKLICLGTGSAFTENNYHSNFLLEADGKYLLVDCGSDIRFAMRDAGRSYKEIDGVYVSHLHDDHGNAEWLGFKTYFDPNCGKPKLYGEQYLLQRLWNNKLSAGMESLEGIEARLDTYFELHPVSKNGFFEWQGTKFDLVQSLHIVSKYAIVDSFGLMFTAPETNKRVYISTDVMFAPETSMKAYYKEADIILHDCETIYSNSGPIKSGVHAHYSDLNSLPSEIKAKMWLYHYQDNVGNNWDEWKEKSFKDGFLGFLQKGQYLPL